jgi:hypothetical protein
MQFCDTLCRRRYHIRTSSGFWRVWPRYARIRPLESVDARRLGREISRHRSGIRFCKATRYLAIRSYLKHMRPSSPELLAHARTRNQHVIRPKLRRPLLSSPQPTAIGYRPESARQSRIVAVKHSHQLTPSHNRSNVILPLSPNSHASQFTGQSDNIVGLPGSFVLYTQAPISG